jgi:hypothetical protein
MPRKAREHGIVIASMHRGACKVHQGLWRVAAQGHSAIS